MLGWRIGVGVLAVSAVAACAAPAPEKPTPPEHASCMASLPDGWRTAFDDGARTVAPAEVPLAVGPAGDVVVARDDGTVRDAALIGADGAATTVYTVADPANRDVGFAALDDKWIVVGVRHNPRGANGVLPTLVRVEVINRADHSVRTVAETSADDLRDGGATIDSVALSGDTVYWLTRDSFAGAHGTVRSFDASSGATAEVTAGSLSSLRTGAAGVLWDVVDDPGHRHAAVGVPAELPAAVADAVGEQRAGVVTDGKAYAWRGDGGLTWWSADAGTVRVTGDLPGASELWVSGPLVFGSHAPTATVVDTRSGASVEVPYQVAAVGGGMLAALKAPADKTAPLTPVIVRTEPLPPLTC